MGIIVILIEPKNSGNIGAIARSMANFNYKDLVLVQPKVSHKTQIARNRAKHAQHILDKAKVLKTIPKVDYLIGTTAKIGTDYNIPRSPTSIREISKQIDYSKKIGLLIGRESSGLNNKEILKCDFVLSIPASKTYPTLNISHATTILLYELFQNQENSTSHIRAIDSKDKEILIKNIKEILDVCPFNTKTKKETQIKVWNRVIGKSFLTKREAFALLGFFKKVKEKFYLSKNSLTSTRARGSALGPSSK